MTVINTSLQMEDTPSTPCQELASLDNESGYEDGVSDVTEVVTSPNTPDLATNENIDSLIADTSVLTLQTDTDSGNSLNTRSVTSLSLSYSSSPSTARPPSAISFASSVSSMSPKRSRIPVRTKSRSVKKTLSTNSIKEELIPRDQVVTPRRKTSGGPSRKKARVKPQSKPLEIWEIQQSLKRGEFVEVELSLQTCAGIC